MGLGARPVKTKTPDIPAIGIPARQKSHMPRQRQSKNKAQERSTQGGPKGEKPPESCAPWAAFRRGMSRLMDFEEEEAGGCMWGGAPVRKAYRRSAAKAGGGPSKCARPGRQPVDKSGGKKGDGRRVDSRPAGGTAQGRAIEGAPSA